MRNQTGDLEREGTHLQRRDGAVRPVMPSRRKLAELLASYGCRLVGGRVVCRGCGQTWGLPPVLSPKTLDYLAAHAATPGAASPAEVE